MKEDIISLKTAKLAKEMGFPSINTGLNKMYTEEGHFYNSVGPTFDESSSYQAPTQSLLQKWLREEHLIHIEILLSEESPYNMFYYRIMQTGKYFTLSHNGIYKNNYEEVLEKGLQEALKLI